jgi:hypothetical protein
MSNVVKNYYSILEFIRSVNCEFEFKTGIGRKEKKCDLEVVLSFNRVKRISP